MNMNMHLIGPIAEHNQARCTYICIYTNVYKRGNVDIYKCKLSSIVLLQHVWFDLLSPKMFWKMLDISKSCSFMCAGCEY